MDAHFIKDLGLDSLDVVECVMAIEEEFGARARRLVFVFSAGAAVAVTHARVFAGGACAAIELTDAQAETIRTPKDMLHYIH